MKQPHTHPSLNCYIRHGCRCPECKVVKKEIDRKIRARRAENKPKVDKKAPLGAEELARLRRMVGLE